jgi:outer membrane protein assembly factor BamD
MHGRKNSMVGGLLRNWARKQGAWLVLGAGCALVAAGCSGASGTTTQQPPRTVYQDAQFLEDTGLYTEAIDKFKKVASENAGTRLGGFAYLRLAELYLRQEDWLQAETNYRLFLSANSNSHLNAYVLYRLLMVNNKKAYTGLLFKERELDRDMDPNKQIILEYKRFYLLYPNSQYAPEVVKIFREARSTLAEHEIVVADFYVRHGQYNAAASRYLYALRNFPELQDPEYALRNLIDAYRRDQQLDLADEMQRTYDNMFGKFKGKANNRQEATSQAPVPAPAAAQPVSQPTSPAAPPTPQPAPTAAQPAAQTTPQPAAAAEQPSSEPASTATPSIVIPPTEAPSTTGPSITAPPTAAQPASANNLDEEKAKPAEPPPGQAPAQPSTGG